MSIVIAVISASKMVVIKAGGSVIASRDSTSIAVNHVSTNVLASFTMWVVLGFGCVIIAIISNAVIITTLRMISAVVSVMESPGTYMPRPLIRAEIRSKVMSNAKTIKTRNQSRYEKTLPSTLPASPPKCLSTHCGGFVPCVIARTFVSLMSIGNHLTSSLKPRIGRSNKANTQINTAIHTTTHGSTENNGGINNSLMKNAPTNKTINKAINNATIAKNITLYRPILTHPARAREPHRHLRAPTCFVSSDGINCALIIAVYFKCC